MWPRILLIAILVGFVGLNGVSFMHAYRFTHVVDTGEKTTRPEDLSFIDKMIVLLTGVKVPKTANTRTPESDGYAYTQAIVVGDDGLESPVWKIVAQHPQRTVILFHGFSSKKSDLLSLGNLLLHHHANLVLVDFPGHGDSSYAWTTLGHREADVVKAVFTEYSETSETPVFLYGTSLGAAAIITAIHRHHIQPDGVILEMPYSSLYETVKQRFTLMGFPMTFPFAELLVFWGGLQHGFNAFALNPGTFAQAISCPVLLLGGAHDERVPVERLEHMAAVMNGQTTFHVFPDAGHEPLFHASPAEYERMLSEFFGELYEKRELYMQDKLL
jgi:alpha-beta hydrolase superfamily lysophospholipase